MKHITHALQFLKPGGVLVALCLSTHHRAEAFKARAEHWEILPAGTFRESNSQVEAVMMKIRK